MSREPTKVAIEDLLRFKRAERPPPGFWDTFDRELRAKQLAAIVAKRPWWSAAWRAGLGRTGIPLGAAAALAVAFVTVRDHREPSTAIADVQDAAVLPVPSADPIAASPEPSGMPGFATVALDAEIPPAPVNAAVAETFAPAPVREYESAPGYSGSAIAPALAFTAFRPSDSPFTGMGVRREGGDLASLHDIGSNFAPLNARDSDALTRVKPSRVEPLAEMASPIERRSGAIAYGRPTGYAADAIASNIGYRVGKLADDQLHDVELSRVILQANRTGLKF